LRKAIALFEADHPVSPNPSWGRADAYIWLGQALQKEEKSADAKAAYQKALEIQPGNQWVQRVLLPSLDKPSKE
jgi:tetratricopeptide (TPR) repeat protein